MPRKWLWLGAAVAAAGVAMVGGSAVWRAHSALAGWRERVAAEDDLRFTSRPWIASVPPGLEPVGSPAVFTDALVFRGHLFIAGPTGLAEYDSDGALIARYRAGIELPPAPLTSLASHMEARTGPARPSMYERNSPATTGPGSVVRASSHEELWIGTSGEGLVVFDGRAFRQIKPEQSRYAKITAILPVRSGRVLLATEKSGVLSFDGSHLRPFHSALTEVQATALAGDDSDLWVGTTDRGLLHWRAGALETVTDPLPDRHVLSLAQNGNDVYAGTALGIAELRGGAFTRVLAPGYFAQALLAAEGKLWMGTLEEGMFQVPLQANPGRGSQLGTSAVCPGCSIRRIFRSGGETYTLAEDALWEGTHPVLAQERRRRPWPSVAALVSEERTVALRDRNISALSLDREGRLWVGYFDRGVEILGGPAFEDDHLFCINRIVQDPARGTTAIATANGLVLMERGSRRRVIGQAEGLIANQVSDVAFRADGSLVAATSAGISFIDGYGISSVYAFQGLVNNHVYALASDGIHTLAGTLGGLSILEGPLIKASYTTSNSGLKHNWITAIVRVNREWFVGTYGAGVMRLDDLGHWETFDDLRVGFEADTGPARPSMYERNSRVPAGPGSVVPASSLIVNQNAMTVSGRAVYAGTLDRGLAVYNRASGRWNFFTSGLPSRNVTAIEAHGGMLYLGTDNGLVKVPESTVVTP